MPTNIIHEGEQAFGGMPHVLASHIGMRSPRMVTMDKSLYADVDGDFVIRPGTLIVKQANGLGAVLPCATAIGPRSPGTDVTILVDDASYFNVGDTIYDQNGNPNGVIVAVNYTSNAIRVDVLTTAIAAGDCLAPPPAMIDDIYGMVISYINISKFSNDVACYTSCSVYGARLPFWNAAIQTKLPEITLVGPDA